MKPKYDGQMDPEVVPLCDALNSIPRIRTFSSCCGHRKDDFRIWLHASSFAALGKLCYFIAGCHSGFYDWRIEARSDCSAKPADFILIGPRGAYTEANSIAKDICDGKII